MSLFKVNVVASNPQDEERVTPPMEVVVDTGGRADLAAGRTAPTGGYPAARKRTFQTATKQLIECEVGYAILRAKALRLPMKLSSHKRPT